MQNYLDYTQLPWGQVFYKILWEQLPKCTGKKILDFGSGFGITANYLAKDNDVIAIEPDADMITCANKDNYYQQRIGSTEVLDTFKNQTFDVILYHNVFEYTDNIEEVIQIFSRLLKDDGVISICKHNHTGRILQKTVFENNVDEVLELLDNPMINKTNLGTMKYYDIEKLVASTNNLYVDKILGIRIFYALQQNNDIKFDPHWQDKILEIEMRVADVEPYKSIAFFHHVLLKKRPGHHIDKN